MPSQMFRNKKLLRFAKDAPYCFCCGKNNDGTIVGAHSNQLRDGKGKGIKAHDFRIAYICHSCHYEIDQGKKTKEDKKQLWEDAHRSTIGWLFTSGRLEPANPSIYE
mgnify:FL=1